MSSLLPNHPPLTSLSSSQPSHPRSNNTRGTSQPPLKHKNEAYKINEQAAIAPLKCGADDHSAIQLQIINQPHYLPKFPQVCANSREVSRRIFTHQLSYNGGYIYVNKARDMFHFTRGEFGEYWFLDAGIARSLNIAAESDEVALKQFKEQIKGVQHFEFYYLLWKAFSSRIAIRTRTSSLLLSPI